MGEPLHIVTMLVGHRYSELYIEKMASMLERHASVPYQLHCVIDRPRELPSNVQAIDASQWTEMRREGMRVTTNKLRLFDRDAIPFEEFLYLDLTLVIQKPLTNLLEYAQGQPQELVIVKDWNYDCFNSCVMRIRQSEKLRGVYEAFKSGKTYPYRNPGDQDFLFAAFKDLGLMDNAAFFKDEHVVSYKDCRKLNRTNPDAAYEQINKGTIVKFFGTPKMHQILNPAYRLIRMSLRQPPYGPRDARFWVKELRQHWR
jgi:hypothetical protein